MRYKTILFSLVFVVVLISFALAQESTQVEVVWMRGGQGVISAIAFSPNGEYIASGSGPIVQIWRVSDGTLIRSFSSGKSDEVVTSVAFSPNGDVFAFASTNIYIPGKTYLYRISEGQQIQSFDIIGPIAFSPNGELIAGVTKYGGYIDVFRVSDGTMFARVDAPSGTVNTITFSASGQFLASAGNREIKVWSISDWNLILNISTDKNIASIALSPDARLLAAGMYDRIIFWNVSDGSIAGAITNLSWATNVAFSPNGQLIASGINDSIKVWRLSDGKLFQAIHTGFNYFTSNIVFSPNGEFIAGGVRIQKDGDICKSVLKLWRVSDGALIRSFNYFSGQTMSIAFSPDGQIIASGHAIMAGLCGEDGEIVIWRASDGTPIRIFTFKDDQVRTVAFSSNGKYLAAAGGHSYYSRYYDYPIRIWDVSDWGLVKTLPYKGGLLNALIFSPDGKYLVAVHNDDFQRKSIFKVWQLSDWSLVKTFESDYDTDIITYSPNGQYLATYSPYSIKIWKMPDGELVNNLYISSLSKSMAFSPDGQYLAVGPWGVPWGQVVVWRVSDWSLVYYSSPFGYTEAVAFSNDGQYLFAVGSGGTIGTWRVSDWQFIRVDSFPKLQAPVGLNINEASFSPNRRFVAYQNSHGAFALARNPLYPTAVEQIDNTIPTTYALHQNYPNPFNPRTTIEFDLPERSYAKLVVYDVLGREIKRLVDGELDAGRHRINFDAGNLPSGVYFCVLEAGKFRDVKKMVLVK